MTNLIFTTTLLCVAFSLIEAQFGTGLPVPSTATAGTPPGLNESTTVTSQPLVASTYSSLSTGITSVTTSSASTSSPTPSTVPSATATTASPNSSGLGTGAKAGIGVGVVAVVFSVGLGTFAFIRRRPRREKNQRSDEHERRETGFSGMRNDDMARQPIPALAPTLTSSNTNRTYPEIPDDVTATQTSTDNAAEATSLAGAARKLSGRASRKEVVPYSGLEVPEPGLELVESLEQPVSPPVDAELAWLKEEQIRLQQRRETLLMVQAIDQEEARIRQRIAEIETGGRQDRLVE
jgi:hypothetical protein